jgi:hypothetical protein
VSREILEERKGKELRKIESAVTLDINFERQVNEPARLPAHASPPARKHEQSIPCRCLILEKMGADMHGA